MPAPSDQEVGRRIRTHREHRQVSLREMARRLDVSPATLSALENGRTAVSVSRMFAVSEVLDISIAALLDEDGLVDTMRVPMSTAAVARWREYEPTPHDPILDAALACIMAKGYHGCSVRDIAEAAHLSVPALYHHHPSKQAMLYSLMDSTMTDLIDRMTAARDDGGDCAATRFALMVECLVLYHTYRRELSFVCGSEMRSLEADSRASIAAKRTAVQRLVDIEVLGAVEAGEFGTTQPKQSSRAVVTMCMSVANWFRPDGPARPADIARSYTQFSLDIVRGTVPSDTQKGAR
ncbi:TetR family transcriptional regulator [Williamsia sp. 1138]|uniref:TetR family transcriptional regulator n=1 Tax=Williamsia sp. 1138 TaxID=1903117 RepID=UPI001AEF9CE0|nr:TetR family transcriptional regulator [Williamsia sp. 1138]